MLQRVKRLEGEIVTLQASGVARLHSRLDEVRSVCVCLCLRVRMLDCMYDELFGALVLDKSLLRRIHCRLRI